MAELVLSQIFSNYFFWFSLTYVNQPILTLIGKINNYPKQNIQCCQSLLHWLFKLDLQTFDDFKSPFFFSGKPTFTFRLFPTYSTSSRRLSNLPSVFYLQHLIWSHTHTHSLCVLCVCFSSDFSLFPHYIYIEKKKRPNKNTTPGYKSYFWWNCILWGWFTKFLVYHNIFDNTLRILWQNEKYVAFL